MSIYISNTESEKIAISAKNSCNKFWGHIGEFEVIEKINGSFDIGLKTEKLPYIDPKNEDNFNAWNYSLWRQMRNYADGYITALEDIKKSL